MVSIKKVHIGIISKVLSKFTFCSSEDALLPIRSKIIFFEDWDFEGTLDFSLRAFSFISLPDRLVGWEPSPDFLAFFFFFSLSGETSSLFSDSLSEWSPSRLRFLG